MGFRAQENLTMTAGCVFALAVALVATCRIVTAVNSSTSYDPHPDYPDCNNSNPLYYTIGDGYCDTSLNVASCGWDGGDCCTCTCHSNSSDGCTEYDFYCQDPLAPFFVEGFGCQNESFKVAEGLRCPQYHAKWSIDSTANATALAEATKCFGGTFDVEWRGHVDINETINVLNGTRLNITGTLDAVVDGGGTVQIFFVYNGSLDINNIKIANGTGDEGGAIILAADSDLVVNDVVFSSNTAQGMGGAIQSTSSSVKLSSATFDGNTAPNGGAMFVRKSTVVGVDSNIFTNNNASKNGGALYIMGTSYVGWNMWLMFNGTLVDYSSPFSSDWRDYCRFSSYYYYDYCSWAVINDKNGDTSFFNNSAGRSGGAIYVDYSHLSWSGTTSMEQNSAYYGGALYLEEWVTVISEGATTFVSNAAILDGGAIYANDSLLSWSGTTSMEQNSAYHGGALYLEGWTAVISEGATTFVSNAAILDGGAISTTDGFVEFSVDGSAIFDNNTCGVNGGAIYASGSNMYWLGTTSLEQNSAYYGGALYLEWTTIRSQGTTTFASNNAIFDGGGISATAGTVEFSGTGSTIFTNNTCGVNGGAIELSNIYDFIADGNVTFSYNSAGSFGGALYASQLDTGPTLTGVAFSGNTAESGGAVFFSAVGTDLYLYSSSEYENMATYASTFNGCRFDGNSASSKGGAIYSAVGSDLVWNTTFESNSAEIGGGMSVSGVVYLSNSSFEDNTSGDGGGPAISNGGIISKMAGLLFSGNGYHCSSDAFMDLEEADVDYRYGIVCDGCDTECEGCTIQDNHSTPVCLDLPDHTQNKDGTAILKTLVLDRGYWRATTISRNILACFNEKACQGGVTGSPDYCMTGYQGPYCSVCSQDWVRTISHRCSKCSSKTSFGPALFAVFGGLAGLMLLLFVYYMVLVEGGRTTRHSIDRFKKVLAVQSLKIIIVSWQIVTQFSEVTNVVYPSLYQGLLDVVAVVNFDFSWILSAGCFDVDFYVGLIAATACPLAVIALLGVTFIIALRRNRGSELRRRIVRRKHANAVILLAFLVYSSASTAVFRTFVCDSLDDGNEYLRADYRIICTTSKHRAFQIYAGFMIAVYPLGIPVLFAILLFRNRIVLENAALRTYNGELVQQSTSSLWKPYKPSVFYYEVVECGRRLMLAGIMVFIYPNTAAQIAVTLAMANIFALISERLNPYDSKMDGWVARIGHIMVVLTMFVALLTKVDVSSEGTQSQDMFAVILITVHIAMVLTGVTETVLLICSVQENDSPLPRPRSRSVLPVDNFSSMHDKRVDRELDR